MIFENIPQELKGLRRWVLWRTESRINKDGTDKPTKVPKQTTNRKAKTDDPDTWASFENAKVASRLEHFDGIGFVLGDGYVGLDFDHCWDPETQMYIDPIIGKVIETLPGYKEFSPSGDGVHIILYLPGLIEAESFKKVRYSYSPTARTGFKKEGLGEVNLELYWTKRYFTMTGAVLPSSREICHDHINDNINLISAHLEEIAKNFDFYKEPRDKKKDQEQRRKFIPLSDNEVIQKAERSPSGKKFIDLWNGTWEPYTGTSGSQSSADLSFLNLLAYWTGKDSVQMNRIFIASGLYREEKGSSYLELSIQKAIDGCETVYSPPPKVTVETSAPAVISVTPTDETVDSSSLEDSLPPEDSDPPVESVEPIEEPTGHLVKANEKMERIKSPDNDRDDHDPPPPPEEPEIIKFLPKIYIQSLDEENEIIDRQYVDISNEIFKILSNQDPRDELIFVQNTEMGILKTQEETVQIDNEYSYLDTTIKFNKLDKYGMKGILNRICHFYKIQKTGNAEKGYILKDKVLAGVPAPVAEDVFIHQDIKGLPPLKQILSRPIINKNYELLNNPGYNIETGFYLDGNKLPKIEEYSIEDAISILVNWLQDFSWKTTIDFVNAISLGLTLLIRSALPYGALPPLFLITSANPGSGKSTLANILGIAITGNVPGATSISNDEEEMRKHLASEAIAGSEYVVFDNAKKGTPIDCSTLASAVTESKVRNRKLGSSEIAEAPNNMTVCFTGNGIQASSELIDRAIFIELDEDQRAGDRKFHTDTIITDTIKQRDQLYNAFYTLFRVWKEKYNCEPLTESKHRQKQWNKVVGAILEAVSNEMDTDLYRGLGENYAKHKIESDPEFEAMSTLVKAIAELYPAGEAWTVKDIFHLASFSRESEGEDYNMLGRWIRSGQEGSRRTDVGRFLRDRENQVFGSGENEYKIEYIGKKQNRNAFTLVQNSEIIE